jgi:hypothetical protein
MGAYRDFGELVNDYPPTDADIQEKAVMEEEEPQFTHPSYDPETEVQTLVRN